jgi:hypothetical protein
MNESDDDSDDWAREDLPDLPLHLAPIDSKCSTTEQQHHNAADEEGDGEWEQKIIPTTNENIVVPENEGTNNTKSNNTGEPMIIVDMTTLSKILSLSEIHCKFDPNSVNDVVAVKALRQQIENDYDTYFKNMDYISERIIIPCGSSVYRPALIELRKDRPGHYFYPIFPPKK